MQVLDRVELHAAQTLMQLWDSLLSSCGRRTVEGCGREDSWYQFSADPSWIHSPPWLLGRTFWGLGRQWSEITESGFGAGQFEKLHK